MPRLFGPEFYPPIFIGTLDSANYAGTPQVRIGPGELIYLCGGTSAYFAIIDPFGNAGQPVTLGAVTNVQLGGCGHVCFDATGQYAFLACETRAGVTTADISNPAAPSLVAELRDTTNLAGASHIERLGNFLFVSTLTRASVAILDCTNPLALVFLGEFRGPTAGTSLSSCRYGLPIPGSKICLYACDAVGGASNLSFGSFDYTVVAAPTAGFSFAQGITKSYNALRGISLDPDFPTRPYVYGASATGWNPPGIGGFSIFQLTPDYSSAVQVFDSLIAQNRRVSFFSLIGSRGMATVKIAGKIYALQTAETIGTITCWDVNLPTSTGVFINGFTWGPTARVSIDGAMDPTVWYSTVYKCWFIAVACFGSSAGPSDTRGLAIFRLSFPGSG